MDGHRSSLSRSVSTDRVMDMRWTLDETYKPLDRDLPGFLYTRDACSNLAFCNLIGYILPGDPWIQTQRAGEVF